MDYVWLLFSFSGRINRARYLAVQLGLLAFWLMLWLKTSFYTSSEWGALQWAVSIAMLWINAATTVKRLHDHNRRGWWAVAIFFFNRVLYIYYGLFFGLSFGVDISIARELLLVMVAVAISLLATWIVIEMFFVIGTEGPNRYGPDPTRTVTNPPIDLGPKPYGVPGFLVHGAGPTPQSHSRG